MRAINTHIVFRIAKTIKRDDKNNRDMLHTSKAAIWMSTKCV